MKRITIILLMLASNFAMAQNLRIITYNIRLNIASDGIITSELNDSRSISKKAPYGPVGTFNSFKFDAPMKDRIDYVFVSNQIEVKRYAVLTDSRDQRYPSDHQPVIVNLELKSGKKK